MKYQKIANNVSGLKIKPQKGYELMSILENLMKLISEKSDIVESNPISPMDILVENEDSELVEYFNKRD